MRAGLLLILLLASQATMAIESEWRLAVPFARTHVVDSLHWDGSRFWATGDAGSLLSSPDGRQWTRQDSHTDSRLHALATDAAGRHVAVGQAGAIVSDGGGGPWVPVRAQTSEDLRAVASDGGGFVAVGTRGAILQSPNGQDWSLRTYPAGIAVVTLRTVAWHAGRWLAAGAQGVMLESPDGLAWTPLQTGLSDDLTAMIWWQGGQRWLVTTARGDVLESPDGRNWQAHSTGLARVLDAIVPFANEVFVVGAQGAVSHSADLLSWTVVPPPVPDDLHAIAGNGSRLVAMGQDAIETYSDDGGQSWQSIRPARDDLHDVAWNGSQWFVAVGGGGTILRSRNGLDWSTVASPTPQRLHAVAWDDVAQAFWAVGECGVLIKGSATGDSWSGINLTGGCHNPPRADPPGSPSPRVAGNVSGKDLNGITVAGGTTASRIVGVGDWGLVIDSADGVNWNWQALQQVAGGQFLPAVRPQRLNAVAWNGLLYVAVGRQGTIVTSTDGQAWTARDSGTDAPLESVIWDAGSQHWFVTGEGVLLTSVDGRTWTVERSLSTANGASGNGLARILDEVGVTTSDYIAVGWFGSILESSNGLDWTTIETGLGDSTLRGVAASPQAVVAVGDGGLILTRVDAADLAVSSPGGSPLKQGVGSHLGLVVRNDGKQTATAVAVTISLPTDLVLSGSPQPGQGTCSQGANSGDWRCPLGDLAPGASVDIGLDVVPAQAGTRETLVRAVTTASEPLLANNVLTVRSVVSASLPSSVSVGPGLGGLGGLFLSALLLLTGIRFSTRRP